MWLFILVMASMVSPADGAAATTFVPFQQASMVDFKRVDDLPFESDTTLPDRLIRDIPTDVSSKLFMISFHSAIDALYHRYVPRHTRVCSPSWPFWTASSSFNIKDNLGKPTVVQMCNMALISLSLPTLAKQ